MAVDERFGPVDDRWPAQRLPAAACTTIARMSERQWASPRIGRARRPRGFTLIELMVVVVVVVVLAAIAVPSFMSQIRASRRAEAIAVLSQIQQAQERWRANCPCYAADLTAVNAGCPTNDCATSSGLGLTLGSARYQFAMPVAPTAAAPNSYTLSAIGQGDQAGDRAAGTSCATLFVSVNNGAAINAPVACWKQ